MDNPRPAGADGSVALVSIMQASAGTQLLKRLLEIKKIPSHHFIIGDIRFYSIVKKEITNADIEILASQLKRLKPRIIAFSLTSTDTLDRLRLITKRIREVSDAYLICGGIGATILPEETLECVDGVCIGEGIEPFNEFIQAVFNRQNYEDIRNFWFRKGSRIIKNPVRPLMDINAYPRLSSEGQHYHISDGLLLRKQEVNFPLVFCSLGCPMQCSYCSVAYLNSVQSGPRVRVKQVAKIMEELLYYKDRGIKYLMFWDACFCMQDKFIEEFSQAYKTQIRLPFFLMTNPNFIKEDNIVKLKECGLDHLGIGIQSYSERVRKIYRRSETNRQIIGISRLLEKYRIKATYDLILGPLDNFYDHLEYIKTVARIRGRFILSMHNYVLLPKTELARYLIDSNIVGRDYSQDYDYVNFNKPKGKFACVQFIYIVFYFLFHPKFLFDRVTLRTFLVTQAGLIRLGYSLRSFIFRHRMRVDKLGILNYNK